MLKTILVVIAVGLLTGCQQDYASAWNAHRLAASCLDSDRQKNVLCDQLNESVDYSDRPAKVPEGYKAVFYAQAAPGAPTGWTLVRGACGGEKDCYR